MKVNIYNQEGNIVGETDLPFYTEKFSVDLVHQVAVAMQARKRQGSAHTKNRGEVRGGGSKPWRQKGTGRARHGSTRSPIWRGGGVAFGPRKERNYYQKINQKMKKAAWYEVLSQKARDKEIYIFEKLSLEKTRDADKLLKKLGLKSVLVAGINPRAFRNIPRLKTARDVVFLDLLNYKYLLVDKSWIT